MFLLHPLTLLNAFISSRRFFCFVAVVCRFFGIFYLDNHLSVNRTVLFSLSDQYAFVSFSCLVAVARTSSTMLSKTCESRYPCLVPNLRGEASSLSPLRILLAVGFYRCSLLIPPTCIFMRVLS